MPDQEISLTDIKNKKVSILLLWHSLNSYNYGVGALTHSHLIILQSIADDLDISLDLFVVGWSDSIIEYINHPSTKFIPFNRKFLFARRGGLFSWARQCDLVLDLAGGDSFTDIYGARRFWFQGLSKAIVLLAGRPLVLSPQTIGPFRYWWSTAFAKLVMKRCRAVVTRDNMSTSLVRKLDATERLVEATDVAFRLPYLPSSAAKDSIQVGVNVSGLLYAGGYRRKNDFSLTVDYAALTRTVLRWFLDQEECQVHLIGHVFVPDTLNSVEDDYRVCCQLATEFEKIIVAPQFASPSEAKSYISSMDFFCGSRMHACIAAFSSGVPTVPIAYSRKFPGLFETLGFRLVADCTKENAPTILDKITNGYKDRDRLRLTVDACKLEAEKRLGVYEKLLRQCFFEVLERGESNS